MLKLFRIFRNVVFLGWLSLALASASIAAGIWALQLSATIATMSASAAATAISHRKEMAKAIGKAKAKARLRRAIAAVPVAGVAALAYFEEQDYQEWLEHNPDGTRQQYACEVSSLTAKVVDDVLQDLPEMIRPGPETVLEYMPVCE